jgi:outer membrane protein OmpA-like peptidoglycan-associated protein
MRVWIIGIAAFLLWSAGASYWYVCKIKGACPESWNVFGGSASGESTAKLEVEKNVAKMDSLKDTVPPIAENSIPNADSTASKNETAPKKTPNIDASPVSSNLSKPFTILFAFAGPQAEGKAALEAYLDELTAYLKQHPGKKAVLKGYTDDTAARENNLKLAQKRCETVAVMLNSRGIGSEYLVLEPLGEADPVATNDSPEGRRLNRRVVISLQQ